jgi:hypothetical protein
VEGRIGVETTLPIEIDTLSTTVEQPDEILILAASWEKRCLGLASRLGNHAFKTVIMTVYDSKSEKRAENIKCLEKLLRSSKGTLKKVSASHKNPLPNVRQTIKLINQISSKRTVKLSIDISTFTRKHLLQLLQGLDLAGLLKRSSFFHTESADYHTEDDEPISQGISSVKAIETFTGQNHPSLESLLVLFLGYEGRRAMALWEHLESIVTLAVIPDPPYKPEWRGRTETQNRYLLSCIPPDNVIKTASLLPSDTEHLLNYLISSERYNYQKFNYRIAPLGTKAQTLGLYRFIRSHRGLATVMYASPVRYREEQATFPIGRTWLIDKGELWS